jgi:hypothetical protein
VSCSRSRHVAWCLAAGGVALGVMRVEVAQLLTSALGCLVDLLNLVVCVPLFGCYNSIGCNWSVGLLDGCLLGLFQVHAIRTRLHLFDLNGGDGL